MADFVQTMKDWRRMCKVYTTNDESCCKGCPIVDFNEHGCGAIFEMEESTDWQRYADAIAEWAAAHPEPVYPTWGEWLMQFDVMGRICQNMPNPYFAKDKATSPIPADIAQKFGIEPNEE